MEQAAETQINPSPRRRIWLWVVGLFIGLLVGAVAAFLFWTQIPAGPLLQADIDAALQSDDRVSVTQRGWIAFIPNERPEVGFIFYPGAKVPPEAYAPLARRIAEAGYLVAIVRPPLNLAILNSGSANAVMENFSAVEQWVLGGHSLGGATAALYTADHPDRVAGLVFLGAYPANDALVDQGIPILSIYGTHDEVATVEEVEASRSDLPSSTRFVAIEGGNHAQFGYYENQRGDGVPLISHEEQHAQTSAAILDLLQAVATDETAMQVEPIVRASQN